MWYSADNITLWTKSASGMTENSQIIINITEIVIISFQSVWKNLLKIMRVF